MLKALLVVLLAAQGVCALVLFARLARGRRREGPIAPLTGDPPRTPTTIVVPTLNEARRIPPLLARLPLQGAPVIDILVVDSGSTDGTRQMVEAARLLDPRIRLLSDPPVPAGWIGKAWALEYARQHAQGDWILCLDADTAPHPGLAAAAVAAAERDGYDAASFSPRFTGQSAAERFLQPSLLVTLVYRSGPPERGAQRADRVLANGQCFLVRRAVLDAHGGYTPVRSSFAEDVSLARHLALAGARVAFLDGARLFDVRSYESAREMWREWGRSIDLKDATPRLRQAGDLVFLVLVQALPLVALGAGALALLPAGAITRTLLWLNATLVAARVALGVAMAPSYALRGVPYWLSPLADPLAVLRVVVSSLRRPTLWRGREY